MEKAKKCSLKLVCFRNQKAIPDAQYLPTKRNREIWRLNREIRSLIQNIVEKHKQQTMKSSNRDFLHSIIEGSTSVRDKSVSIEEFIIDNCKIIYYAGLETTAVAATWCLLLLAVYPEWQDRVRKEILGLTHAWCYARFRKEILGLTHAWCYARFRKEFWMYSHRQGA